jgi:hypothetical protein
MACDLTGSPELLGQKPDSYPVDANSDVPEQAQYSWRVWPNVSQRGVQINNGSR